MRQMPHPMQWSIIKSTEINNMQPRRKKRLQSLSRKRRNRMALKSETTDEIKRLIMQHNVIIIEKLALYFLHMTDQEKLELVQKLDALGDERQK